VLSSKAEGLPNVCSKLALGRPVVSTRQAGSPRCSGDMPVPIGDAKALADTVARILRQRVVVPLLPRYTVEAFGREFLPCTGASSRCRHDLRLRPSTTRPRRSGSCFGRSARYSPPSRGVPDHRVRRRVDRWNADVLSAYRPRPAAHRGSSTGPPGVRPQSRGAPQGRVAAHRSAKRDCAITLHADFVHAPERWKKW